MTAERGVRRALHVADSRLAPKIRPARGISGPLGLSPPCGGSSCDNLIARHQRRATESRLANSPSACRHFPFKNQPSVDHDAGRL